MTPTLLALVALARAYESEPQPVLLEDSAPVFENIAFDSGIIPSGSPVGVQFTLGTKGGTDVTMEGDAYLSWPDDVTFLAEGAPRKGFFQLDASLDAVTAVVVDLSSYGGPAGSFEIDHRSLAMDGRAVFDPFVLEGASEPRVEIEDTTDSTQLINYSYEIFAGVSLDFTANMTPTITVGFEGVQWLLNEGVVTQENQALTITPEQGADFVVDSVFRGLYDGTIALVFDPQVAVTAPFLGTIPLVSFEYPLDLVTDSFEQDFEPVALTFPMPVLEPGSDTEDLGEVEVTQLRTVNIPVKNVGNLSLQGQATIEGDPAFSVFPAYFNAAPGTEDGLVVTFAPTEVGDATAELVLTSNDPGYPDIRVYLSGSGVKADEGQDPGPAIVESTSGCGCESSPVGSAVPALATVVGALALARRRRA
jgi:MYXO-CTERM domain-containing protein